MHQQRVDILRFEADVVDLVGFIEAGIGLMEHLDEGAATKIEVIADALVAALEIEGRGNAENVAIKRLGGVQVMRKDTGMSDLPDQRFRHAFPPSEQCRARG